MLAPALCFSGFGCSSLQVRPALQASLLMVPGLGGASAAAGAGPDGHIGFPLPFRACVQAGPFVLATSGSLMKTSVAALPTACSSACPEGVLPLISGLSEPPAGGGLLACAGHIHSPVPGAVLSAPAAGCKIRLRWGPSPAQCC